MDTELAIVAGRIDLLLDRVEAAATIAERRFARDALARGLLLADPGAVDEAQLERARSLRTDPSTIEAARAPRQPHAVSVPLVAPGAGSGFIRQVQLAFDPVGLLLGDRLFDQVAARAIADAVQAAATRVHPPSEPASHRLVAARPAALRGARVEGASLSAAAFLSAMALWSDRRVREDRAFTGAVRGDAVISVGHIPQKVRAAEVHGATTLVVPAADVKQAERAAETIAIVGVTDLDALIEAGLCEPKAVRTSPERAVEDAGRVFATGWRGYRWPTVREHLRRVSATLPTQRIDLRVAMLSRLGAAQRHLGDPVGSLSLLREAESLVRSELGQRAVPDAPITYLFQQTAMTCRQLSRFTEARKAARRGVETARRARLRGELIKALGCLGLVEMSRGQVDRAIEAFAESLEITLEHDPHRTARTHAYLIDAYGAAGDRARVESHFRAAMADVAASPSPHGRRAQESWVRTNYGGALLAVGDAPAAIEALEHDSVRVSLIEEPLPGLTARRHLGVGLVATGQLRRGFEVLAASPLVYGRALEPHLRFLSQLNVLTEAYHRIENDEWGPDIAGRARHALAEVPSHDRVPAYLGRALIDSGTMLERGGRPRSTRALSRLLARCARLA